MMDKAKQLVPYELTEPGWEASYSGETRDTPDETTDGQGNVFDRWSTWTFVDGGKDWSDFDEEIVYINSMQEKLGELSDDIRQIRAHIGSFVPCDNGVPVTVDELLNAIGSGKLVNFPFHNGCWLPEAWWQGSTSQPRQPEAMAVIQAVLLRYLDGKPEEDFSKEFPFARQFVARAYEWLGARSELTDLQVLLLRKLLIPFALWSKMSIGDTTADLSEKLTIFEAIERQTAEVDAKIQKSGGVPPEGMPHEYPGCDCHHNTFRYIENWIYRIGRGEGDIPTRKRGSERERIGRLSFGYSLALDKWLQGVPMQFLLLDLGHVDLGFDPRNEILRTYSYLGEDRTPVKEWLAACLWYSLTYNPMILQSDYKIALGRAHKGIVEKAESLGVSLREWMDSKLGKRPECR